jgi:hypothetical protein
VTQDIQRLLDSYLVWLRDRTSLRQLAGGWVEITTPYLDRHNDYIQIYATRRNGGYVLTDDGHTITDLVQSGCALNSSKRQELLRTTLSGFGVQLSRNALEVNATEGTFSLRKHSLVQAILAVNDLFYLAAPLVTSLFYEDVVQWLDLLAVRYTPKVKFTGKSGYDHLFDFVIPKSKQQPERVLKTIKRASRDTAEAVAFAWIDTREVRAAESRAYAIVDDSAREVSTAVLDALRQYDVKPVLWSKRGEVGDELVA